MNARTICLGLGLMLATGVAVAQVEVEWERTYRGWSQETCYSAIQTSDGGFAMAGEADSTGWFGFRLVRTNAEGDSLWSYKYRQRNYDCCFAIIQTADDGFALAGYTSAFGATSEDFSLVKVNSEGELQWSRSYGGRSTDICQSIVQVDDGGFVLAGYTRSFGSGGADFWLLRTNSDGDSLWSHTYGGSYNDQCYSATQNADGGISLVGGSMSDWESSSDAWLVRTDAEGDSLWSRSFGGEEKDLFSSIVESGDGDLILLGQSRPTQGFYSSWLMKLSSEGELRWSRSYDGEGNDMLHSIVQTSDGGYALAGGTSSIGAGYIDSWLLRTDENGDSLWSLTSGGEHYEFCTSLIQTADSAFVLGGIGSSDSAYIFYLIKTTPDPISVREPRSTLNPLTFNLFPAYPNPFNSTTRIEFEGTAHWNAPLRLEVFDPLGRRVAELIPSTGLVNGPYAAGRQTVFWDASRMPAGAYVVRLEAGKEQLTQRLSLVK